MRIVTVAQAHTHQLAPQWTAIAEGFRMPSYTLDLDRRVDALIELLDCPVRWSSKEYVLSLADHLVMRCDDINRPDLSARIVAKIIEII